MRAAKAEPGRLWIGIDPVAVAMAKSSAASMRARLGNAIFALGSIESLPRELDALAERVTIMLPWGSLLRAVALPDTDLLRNVAAVCRRGATVEVMFSASDRDASEVHRLGLDGFDPVARRHQVEAGYAAAGFCVESIAELSSGELRALGTTWAKRLCHDRRRRAWRLTAVVP